MIITIDGPSGSGKSTLARELAKRLGYLYLDTGAMYRAVALKALEKKIPLSNSVWLGRLSRQSRISFRVDPGHRLRVLLDGKDVTDLIRSPKVSRVASQVAIIPAVRRALVAQQKTIGKRGRIVAEGRDTGTVVFPEAELKIFLTANSQERAKRRLKELKGAGHRASLTQVLRQIKERDRRDLTRTDSPLVPAPGAWKLDNSKLTSREVVDKILDYVKRTNSRSQRAGVCLV